MPAQTQAIMETAKDKAANKKGFPMTYSVLLPRIGYVREILSIS